MIRSIIELSMKLRFLILIVAATLLVIGISQLRNMPVDALPEFSPPYVEVQTEALGLSAEEVEALITVPLEADLLNGVAWLESISSRSITGLSSILLFFEPGTDIIRARQMVQERLTQAHALPNVSTPPTMLQPLSSTNRVMMIGLSSDSLSLIETSVLARWNVKPKLLGVPGVANVAIWGQRERQLQVLVDPEALHAQGVSLQQVINTSGNALWVSPLSFLNASYPGTGGWIETPNQRLGIRHLLPITTAEDLARVSVEGAEGLQLGDVAQIVEDHQPLIGDALIDDRSGLLLVVEKFPGESTAAVTQGVLEAIRDMAPGLSGLEFDPELFQAVSYIEQARSNLSTLFIVGAMLMVLVLAAFLFDWRSGLVSLVAIPLSIVAALLVLYYRGATLNMVVLIGLLLALAVVIDDAVLSVSAIKRHVQQARAKGNGTPVAKVVLDASLEVRRPLMFATLILLVMVVPLYILTGLAGAFFAPLATTYVLAILAAFVVALTLTPALSLILLAKAPESSVAEVRGLGDSPLARWLGTASSKGLIERSLPTVIIGAALVVASLFVLPQLRQRPLLPDFKEPSVLIRWQGEPGTSRAAMVQAASEATRELRALASVEEVAAHVGRAITSDEVSDVDAGEIWVKIEPNVNYEEAVASIEAIMAAYPDFAQGTMTYLQEVTDAAAAPPSNTLRVRVFGDDLATLKTKTAEINDLVAGVSGVSNAQVDALVEKPSLSIEVDLARAERVGLKPGDVRRAAATLLSGIGVGNLFEEQKVFDVVVWGVPEVRADIESVRNLLIDTPSGDQVRLAEVAEVSVTPTFDTVLRQDVSRYLDVVATVSGRGLGAVARDIETALAGIDFPLEFHAEVVEEYAVRLSARRTLLGFAVAAIIGLFLLQQAAFRSWRSAMIAFAGVLVSVTGGVLVAGLLPGGAMISIVAGLLAVLALAVRNTMILISHYQQLHLRAEQVDADLIQRGTRDKLAGLATSSAVMAAALLSILFFGNRAGLELLRPMATVMLGGLVTLAFANLFVLPALYLRFKGEPEPEFDFGPAETWLPVLETADATD